jgi:anaerobic ribonucleoside-triphosphate reductase activating protein
VNASGELLRVHRFLPHSYANGPGARAVIWVQGCTLGCPGCFNPATHPHAGGEMLPVATLFRRIVAASASTESPIEGVTISGGEPLQQQAPLSKLLTRLRNETSLSLLLFTGYSWAEIQWMPHAAQILACLDVLITGRYDATQRAAHGLLGSSNQRIHLLSARYSAADLRAAPPAEVIVTAEGEVVLSGIDPLAWEPSTQ